MEFKRENFIKMKSFEGIVFLGLRHDFFDEEKIEEKVEEPLPAPAPEPEPEPIPEPPKEEPKPAPPPAPPMAPAIEDIPKVNGKKECPFCGEGFAPQGFRKHVLSCAENSP